MSKVATASSRVAAVAVLSCSATRCPPPSMMRATQLHGLLSVARAQILELHLDVLLAGARRKPQHDHLAEAARGVGRRDRELLERLVVPRAIRVRQRHGEAGVRGAQAVARQGPERAAGQARVEL